MRSKILSKRTLLIVVLVGLAISPALLFYLIHENPTQNDSVPPAENSVTLPEQEQAGPGLPIRLIIPSISVNAAIEYVGITSEGEMGVPEGPDDVAWFELGPRPGEIGSAVMAGHYGSWKDGRGSVFDDLNKLKEGDRLYVEDEKGVIISFVVRESRRYDPKADASDVFNSNDGKAHLNLVTCEGVWDQISQNYSQRLVVFADKE
jgi:LPXTG-site transpeptidase (sortase) family protein